MILFYHKSAAFHSVRIGIWKYLLCYAAIAFALLRFSFPLSAERTQHNAFRFVQTGWAIASFGSLCVIASVVELAVRFSGGKANLHPSLPSSIAETFFCIANFACASFYEEAIYRLYLPEMLGAVLKDAFLQSKKSGAKTEEARSTGKEVAHENAARESSAENAVRISETLSVIAFALSHRYLGLPSVVNAFFAGIMLRLCCKKSGTLWTNTAAHFAYNMLSLVLFAHMH